MDCIFCKIIKKEIPADIVYEDDQILAFKDRAPSAPVHILFVPKKHIQSLVHADKGDESMLGHLLLSIAETAKKLGIDERGFRVVTNNGKDGGQIVHHLHFHLLGGKKLGW
ncbi:MAG: histidine triad nucleotide-binding protein [Candidatus Abawacabacteria bacterium RBG_16_42_10]|uniref:Histidine triad nucleotide-binding protein n=1 Tax=Candidatus Abawacabacteria bacterium RBG_16_42_10 TaxID=1817814 RepID=A0A1F4XL25_9BACT|nr:MAG: histidine triad nucleotide-binding protein [Candidatus Abawacabacteria bacterium RBG_16_42_10]